MYSPTTNPQTSQHNLKTTFKGLKAKLKKIITRRPQEYSNFNFITGRHDTFTLNEADHHHINNQITQWINLINEYGETPDTEPFTYGFFIYDNDTVGLIFIYSPYGYVFDINDKINWCCSDYRQEIKQDRKKEAIESQLYHTHQQFKRDFLS